MKHETLRRYFGDMPPLDHYPLREYREFRWEDSEVVEYMIDNHQFMTNIFHRLQRAGAIVFDPETRTWRGYRYQAQEGCCQKSSAKLFSPSTMPPSKTQSPSSRRGTGGICDGRQTPNPLLTATDLSDSDSEQKMEVRYDSR
jgi:hypothetical protein